MKKVILVAVLFGLSACASLETQAIKGSKHSGVRNLQVGMSATEVSERIGEYQLEDFDPSNGIYSCRSYQYDEAFDRKYVHVRYYDGAVTSASDDHRELCIYQGDVPAS